MGERDREKVKEGMGGRGNRSFIVDSFMSERGVAKGDERGVIGGKGS